MKYAIDKAKDEEHLIEILEDLESNKTFKVFLENEICDFNYLKDVSLEKFRDYNADEEAEEQINSIELNYTPADEEQRIGRTKRINGR